MADCLQDLLHKVPLQECASEESFDSSPTIKLVFRSDFSYSKEANLSLPPSLALALVSMLCFIILVPERCG